MTNELRGLLVSEALDSGNWMLRRSDGGKAYGGFQWSPIGEWTEAPDWNPAPVIGGGLHGVGPRSVPGYWTEGEDIDFCMVDPDESVHVSSNRILKVRRAMVLLRNELPEGLSVGGLLDLEGTGVTELPVGLSVGGDLDLRGTGVTELPVGLSVGDAIYGLPSFATT